MKLGRPNHIDVTTLLIDQSLPSIEARAINGRVT